MLLNSKDGGALDGLLFEDDFEIQIQVTDLDALRICIRMYIMGDTGSWVGFFVH